MCRSIHANTVTGNLAMRSTCNQHVMDTVCMYVLYLCIQCVHIITAILYSLQINNNGVLNFNTSTTEYVPQPFPISGNEYIALFWTDLDTNECPEIINTAYYRQFTVADSDSSSEFEQINKIVESSSEFKTISGCSALSFRARWAFAVTWREVRYYRGECDKVQKDVQLSFVPNIGLLSYNNVWSPLIPFSTMTFRLWWLLMVH